MTKRIILAAVLTIANIAAFAQLGTPKITAKDTFYIVSVYYNGTELNREDWPDNHLVEDAVNIYIAGYTYRKGQRTYSKLDDYVSSWGGHIDYIAYSDAICNGKKQRIATVKPRKDCNSKYYAKYVIEDYDFYLMTERQYYAYLGEILLEALQKVDTDTVSGN